MHRAAIVLGGGRSSRMGTDKLALVLDGRRLLERVVLAAIDWADEVVVAGDRPIWWNLEGVSFVREDPPFSGPAAALVAALEALGEPTEVLVLAGDLASPNDVVRVLTAGALGADGLVLVDEQGWDQWLAGRYRGVALESLRRRAPGGSVRALFQGFCVARVPVPNRLAMDLDNPEQAKIAGVSIRECGEFKA